MIIRPYFATKKRGSIFWKRGIILIMKNLPLPVHGRICFSSASNTLAAACRVVHYTSLHNCTPMNQNQSMKIFIHDLVRHVLWKMESYNLRIATQLYVSTFLWSLRSKAVAICRVEHHTTIQGCTYRNETWLALIIVQYVTILKCYRNNLPSTKPSSSQIQAAYVFVKIFIMGDFVRGINSYDHEKRFCRLFERSTDTFCYTPKPAYISMMLRFYCSKENDLNTHWSHMIKEDVSLQVHRRMWLLDAFSLLAEMRTGVKNIALQDFKYT